MIKIELVPDANNCIETVARREFQNLVNECLQNERVISEFAQKIELLRVFLESADFRKLRRESEEYLSKGQKVKFLLYFKHGAITCKQFVDERDTSVYILPRDIPEIG